MRETQTVRLTSAKNTQHRLVEFSEGDPAGPFKRGTVVCSVSDVCHPHPIRTESNYITVHYTKKSGTNTSNYKLNNGTELVKPRPRKGGKGVEPRTKFHQIFKKISQLIKAYLELNITI